MGTVRRVFGWTATACATPICAVRHRHRYARHEWSQASLHLHTDTPAQHTMSLVHRHRTQPRVVPDRTVGCSRIRSWLHGENHRPQTSCSRFVDLSCSCNTSSGFFLDDVFRTTVRWREVRIHLFSSVGDHSARPLLDGKPGVGSVGFCWSYAPNLWVLARGADMH